MLGNLCSYWVFLPYIPALLVTSCQDLHPVSVETESIYDVSEVHLVSPVVYLFDSWQHTGCMPHCCVGQFLQTSTTVTVGVKGHYLLLTLQCLSTKGLFYHNIIMWHKYILPSSKNYTSIKVLLIHILCKATSVVYEVFFKIGNIFKYILRYIYTPAAGSACPPAGVGVSGTPCAVPSVSGLSYYWCYLAAHWSAKTAILWT